MPRITWSPEAVADLDAIHAFIARDSEFCADEFIERLLAAVRKIPDFPLSGRRVPEAPDQRYREKVVGNYRIIYRALPDRIEIVTIWHGARLLRLPPDDQ